MVGAVLVEAEALTPKVFRGTAELADLFGVARSTVYRAVQRDQLQNMSRRLTSADGVTTRQ